MPNRVATASPFEQILTQSANMQDVVKQAKKFADLNAPLLIQGETGTGKDLLAKACHLRHTMVPSKKWNDLRAR